jgi:phosphoheptose isomerase
MNYIEQLREALRVMDSPMYEDTIDNVVFKMVGMSKMGARLFVAGNGGSAAIASHFAADIMKTSLGGPSTICLTDNVPLLTALSNDTSYENSLRGALAMHQRMKEDTQNDMLIVISSSGNSKNIVNLIGEAHAHGMMTFGLVGMTGGEVLDAVDFKVHVHSGSYGVIEDCHHVVMHDITSRLMTLNLMRT